MITPTRAGSRKHLRVETLKVRDHPRARGEQGLPDLDWLIGGGSPPRARGAVVMPLRYLETVLITPARAGSSSSRRKSTLSARDHPRARGEQDKDNGLLPPDKGSPPRARGAAQNTIFMPIFSGITPARAGSSFRSARHAVAFQDHPRARGEQREKKSHILPGFGSPPRARGAEGKEKPYPAWLRITPARAGSSL